MRNWVFLKRFHAETAGLILKIFGSEIDEILETVIGYERGASDAAGKIEYKISHDMTLLSVVKCNFARLRQLQRVKTPNNHNLSRNFCSLEFDRYFFMKTLASWPFLSISNKL